MASRQGRNFTPGRLEVPRAPKRRHRLQRRGEVADERLVPKDEPCRSAGEARPFLAGSAAHSKNAAAFEPRIPSCDGLNRIGSPCRASTTGEGICSRPAGGCRIRGLCHPSQREGAHLLYRRPDPGSRRTGRSGVDTNALTSAALALRRAFERFVRRLCRNEPKQHATARVCRSDLTSECSCEHQAVHNARWRSRIAPCNSGSLRSALPWL